MDTNEVEEVKETQKDHYMRWTRKMDEHHLEVLKQQKAKGLKEDKNFSPEPYQNAINALNQAFNITLTKAHIVNCLNTLKEQMGLTLALLQRKSSYTWNDMTKTIEAENEVWDDLIKVRSQTHNI